MANQPGPWFILGLIVSPLLLPLLFQLVVSTPIKKKDARLRLD